jgi:polyphenol oxidase
MNIVNIEGYEFIIVDMDGAKAVFSTAKNGLDFNKAKDFGINNIQNLKKWFNLKDVGYLNQVHGNKVIDYKNKVENADGIITKDEACAVGVFNADCVPILLYDKENSVICAVHSGWKGTLSRVLSKAIEKMKLEYGSLADDILVCIGPHIQVCCYEVGKEVIDKFRESDFYKDKEIFHGNNLDLKKCFMYQLSYEGIQEKNIKYLDICTACETKYEMYSYRKNKNCGRMFSFIYFK